MFIRNFFLDPLNNAKAEMQESNCEDVASLNECSYMKPLPENLNNIDVESSIMYKTSYSFRNENLVMELYNDWTEIENKNDWKIYPTRIPKRFQYFKGKWEEPNFDHYEFDINEPKFIDKYLFEDVPEIIETPIFENSTKEINEELENISEDDSTYDCCSIFSIDETFCTCEYTSINKESINSKTGNSFDEEHKNECHERKDVNDDLKENSSSTENSSCQSEIASPIYEVISSSNHKKDFYLELDNSCPKLEATNHVSIINTILLVYISVLLFHRWMIDMVVS